MKDPMTLGTGCPIDLPSLTKTRMLVQASSGGGKSHAIRRLIEQTAPHIQQLIIDPEGEFATLREKFDFLIAAPSGADAVATPQTAALLARRLLEAGVSAVLDIYELKAHERQLFVKRFGDALVNAPRELWHPVLLVIDEIHVFCPQIGSAESSQAVIDLATRGRKRGICLIGATQRLSKLHKDAAAELQNKLIGRTGLDVDVQRASEELGMSKRDAMLELRNLEPGEFFAFGPALSRSVERIQVGKVITTHPQSGSGAMKAPPAPSPKLRSQLAKLADLQQEAEQEARTIEELTTLANDLKRKLDKALRQAAGAGVPQAEVDRQIAAAVAELKEQLRVAQGEAVSLHRGMAEIRKIVGGDVAALIPTPHKSLPLKGPINLSSGMAKTVIAPKKAAEPVKTNDGLSAPEQRIVDAIAWLHSIGVEEPAQPAVAFLAGYTYGAGSYNNARGKLHQAGLVEYRPEKKIALSDAGRDLANWPEVMASNIELHVRVLHKLGTPEKRLLQPLLDVYPNTLSNPELAAAAGYTHGAGSYNNARGKLRSLGLIEYHSGGTVGARALLFPLAK